MRLSRFPVHTTKETPADAEVISAKLMLRAGYIRKLAAGLYTWTPWGLRVLRKIEAIVREEMNRAGALEVLMPSVQPAELWQETGRWEKMGDEMLRLRDRHKRDFCYGPTHEEVITDYVRGEYKSYKQLPVNYYQIQTKFRDERRPRFGVMRAREFLMKDAYSFHMDETDLAREYQNMRQAYTRIFTRLGAKFRVVQADSGNIGGSASEEFHVLAQSGEDLLAVASQGEYAANIEAAISSRPSDSRASARESMNKVATPGLTGCAEVAALLKQPIARSIKSIAVMASGQPWLLLLRGDHAHNEIKISKLPGFTGYRLANETELRELFQTTAGYIGPVNLPVSVKIAADHSVTVLSDFLTGANEKDFHLTGVNFGRDCREPDLVADLRNVNAGEAAPGGGVYELHRGIEVGHIFQLGRKYSESMQLNVLDANGKAHTPTMGCYGIGVSRLVAAVIEQRHDESGIVWPDNVAPFRCIVCPIGYSRSEAVRNAADELYRELNANGFETVLDDRDLRPGAMFADADLIGIPHRFVIGDKGLAKGVVEYKRRDAQSALEIPLEPQSVFDALTS